MPQNLIQIVYENLEKKLSDEAWVKEQDPEFINLLRQLSNITQNLSAQIYIFIDLFQQYVAAMYQSPLFNMGTAPSDEVSTGTSPTQTPAPANREQRRAKVKEDKKLLVPEKKLIVP
jgi:hypothetical protein